MAISKEQVEISENGSARTALTKTGAVVTPGSRAKKSKAASLRLIRRLDSRFVRNSAQIGIAAFVLYVGFQFFRFVNYFNNPGSAEFVKRPPSVEGFLPISALLGLKNWLLSGAWDTVHPAGLTILLAIIAVSLLFKKAFCSWICPIGTGSEILWKLGRRIFGTNIRPPRYLDVAFRSLKYLLLGLLVKIILIDLSLPEVRAFLDTDYNKVADVKMLHFFLSPSNLVLAILAVLVIGSLLIKNFWCRYLCPYGALLGIVSIASPFKIRRDSDLCVDCGKCAKVCPSMIKVDKLDKVGSTECTGCLDCVASCPKPGALNMSPAREYKTKSWVIITLIFAVFFGAIIVAKLTGHWETSLTIEDYRRLIPIAEELGHPQ